MPKKKSREELVHDILNQRKAKLAEYESDPAAFIFGAVRTKDEHDQQPIKNFPYKPYLGKLLDIWHEGEQVEFLIKSRQLMVTWLAVSYISWYCRFHDHRLAFLQSKKEADAANLVFNKDVNIGRLSFIETHLPRWLQQDIKWSFGTAIYPNGSKAWAIPQGPQHYESYVPSIVFNDEASLQDKWDLGHAALKPCIENGGKCITVATVRMPMPYSREMSGFDKQDAEVVMPGLWKFRSNSGASAHALHYVADPDKDPTTPQGEIWYEKATEGYIGGPESYLWKQHMEIDFEATKQTKLIPFWNDYRHCFIIDDIPLGQQQGWKYYAGFDYGKRNQTVFGVYAVDQGGNRYVVSEVSGSGETLGGVPGISKRVRNNPYYEFLTSIKADPSLWNENQAKKQGGYTSLARLFKQEGLTKISRAPIKGSEADRIAIERLLFHYWQDPQYPTLYIFRSCKTHIRQFKGLRYKDWGEAVADERALKEELVDKENDAWDSWKYAEACRPAPSIQAKIPPHGSFMDVRNKYIRDQGKVTLNPRRGRSSALPTAGIKIL